MIPPGVRSAYPWTGKRVAVDGGSMHVLDEGPRDAPVLLCVHGNPTWSFYWRAIVKAFAGPYRVVVPDHLGCGLSDKPQDWPYRLDGHVRNLRTVIDALGLADITYVVHDWGGAIGMGAATRDPSRARRFVITNTAAFRSLRIPPSIASVKIPGFGALAVRGFNAFARAATIRAVERSAVARGAGGIAVPVPELGGSDRHAPVRAGHPALGGAPELRDARGDRGRPRSVPRSSDARALGRRRLLLHAALPRGVGEAVPRAEIHHWSDVGHYVMEDAPDRVVPLVEHFLARYPLARVA